MLVPFVGLFVAFLVETNVDEAGYKSGMIIGVFMLGQVLSSKLWGYTSDTYGRKIPLVVSVASGAVMMFCFGLSGNFYLCCFLRFVQGFLNGSTLIAKAIISDITDASNQAKGFALVSITWSAGFVVGSFCGGFFYDPANNRMTKWMGISQDGFLSTHPAFLPSCIIAGYNVLAVVAAIVVLPETNNHRRDFRSSKVYRAIFGAKADNVVVETDPSEFHAAPEAPKVESKISYMQAMSMRSIRNITLFYMLVSGTDMAFAETLPLWAVATRPEGLALHSADVALLNLTFSIPAVIANMYFHRVREHFKDDDMRLWRVSTAISCLSTILVPFATCISSSTGSYIFVLAFGLFRQVGTAWMYSIVHLTTAQVSPRGFIGSIYAISQSFASLTRSAVPFVVAPLFAWSIDGEVKNPFPFNHYLVFLLAIIPPVVLAFFTHKIHFTPVEDKEIEAITEEIEANEDPDDGQDGVYLSLVASFVTNPLNDWFLDCTEEERKKEVEYQRQRTDSVRTSPRERETPLNDSREFGEPP
ncbi:transporter-like protein [Angomonas deanei]|uniref:Sugar (And other) transporter/Major Facilitator Superfamily, putative n=1 Tax=Angomonas deanei TaxID=59799 RepID=A0A7G2CD34_9TRYP|nr:transporter-like protein [Angomonas deanei]CAD2216754.1 Sugar (and other) transporter/Major Facilitator Superfamily, putative [Angomonas deanei]|eukprot:EPY23531.1 transporter-like protein [Angomonas deanei]